MNKIYIFNTRNFKIRNNEIKKVINDILKKQKIDLKIEVNVSFVDDLTITRLHKKYLHLPGTTDVLSFPIDELKSNKSSKVIFRNPDNLIRLGDIVISFPQAKKQAGEGRITVTDEINKLVEHGLLHLLGIHHE